MANKKNGTIKAKDINDFIKYATKLNEVMDRIRLYMPEAHIFATPNTLSLMLAEDDPESRDWQERATLVAAQAPVSALEAGDW